MNSTQLLGHRLSVLILALLWLSGCSGNPNDRYLQQAEPSVRSLMQTWRDLNRLPKVQDCDAISLRLQDLNSKLKAIDVPEGSAAFHGLLLESLKLQEQDVVIKKKLAQLGAGSEEPKLTKDERQKEFTVLRAKVEENTETMRELSQKIQAALEKL